MKTQKNLVTVATVILAGLAVIAATAFVIGCSSKGPVESGGGGGNNDNPPVADFSASPTSGKASLTVNFQDESEGDIESWDWDFGDSKGQSSDENPSHTYSSAGSYTVTLTIVGPGGEDTKTKTGYINVIEETPPPPTACFSYTPGTVYKTQSVQFTSCSAGNITSYKWSFGDGYTSTSQNPTHSYSQVGTFTVSLTVEGPGGSHTTAKSIQVRDNVSTVSASLPSVKFWPPRYGSGDCEFNGHGPKCSVNVALTTYDNGTKLYARVFMDAVETVSDWTHARGSQEFYLWTAPSGWQITSYQYSGAWLRYTDTDHAWDEYSNNFCTFKCMGDSDGSDVCGSEWHDTHVEIYFKSFKIYLRKL